MPKQGKTHSTPKQPRNSKRIHSVTIKRMYDESPDTSWLGEYANSSTSEFSIDRAHDEDCPQQTFNKPTETIETIELLERIMVHIRNVKDAHCGTIKNRTDADKARDLDIWTDYDDAKDICIDASTEVEEECTCGWGGEWHRSEYWPEEIVKCKRCGKDTNALDVFPGGVCLTCWEAKEGRAPLTNADFNGMVNTFKGKPRK